MMVNYGHVTQRGLCFISKWLSGYILHSQFISHPRSTYKLQEILSFVFVSFHFIHSFCQ